jgi:site-specific recombinase XerD
VKPPVFSSPLAGRMVSFIAFKRMQGHDYRDGEKSLRRFDTFLGTTGCADGVLRMQDIDRYRATLAGRSIRTQCGVLSLIRQFSIYLHAMEPRCEPIPARQFPRQARPIRFYPLTAVQVNGLMSAAVGVLGDDIAAHSLRFLIGLLYSTGLRISEALALNAGDVDFKHATLFVRRGKFRKERLVPLSPSTLQATREWVERRASCIDRGDRAPLLVLARNRRLTRWVAERYFRRLCIHVGLTAKPPPRLHDLRHNYACCRIALWRQAQADVDALLPVLANAMGHVDFFSTQVYLHIDAAGLQQASAKFHAYTHVHNHPESSK